VTGAALLKHPIKLRAREIKCLTVTARFLRN